MIGANDTGIPQLPKTPPARLPECQCCAVLEAHNVIVFKRSMAAPDAGVQNPLFFRENAQMLFGDAKTKVDEIVAALGALVAVSV